MYCACLLLSCSFFFFFKQKTAYEMRISDGVQTCALPIWGIWPVRTTILTGPPRSGRSTLGRLFVRKTGGRVVDDARQADEEALLHAWNDAQTGHYPLLLIAYAPPAQWDTALPDPNSRLPSAPHVAFEEPGDARALDPTKKETAAGRRRGAFPRRE